MRLAIPLLAAALGIAHGASEGEGKGSCGGPGGALDKEAPFPVLVTSHLAQKVQVFWDEHDDAVRVFNQHPGGVKGQLVADMPSGSSFTFHVQSGFTFYVQDKNGVRLSSITIVPGVDEYALEPGNFPVPPWGSLEEAGQKMFAAGDDDKDERLSWAEMSPMFNSTEMKAHGVEGERHCPSPVACTILCGVWLSHAPSRPVCPTFFR